MRPSTTTNFEVIGCVLRDDRTSYPSNSRLQRDAIADRSRAHRRREIQRVDRRHARVGCDLVNEKPSSMKKSATGLASAATSKAMTLASVRDAIRNPKPMSIRSFRAHSGLSARAAHVRANASARSLSDRHWT
jgi:hypothetical protein